MNKVSRQLWWTKLRLLSWWHDTLPMRAAWWLPRRVALWAFVRVYACTGDGPGPEYSRAYKAFEAGAGK